MTDEGRYEYLEKIGEGGMATVYRGMQRSLNRQVAIKVLSATLSDNPSVIKRFERESLIIARLNHPNIIHVIDRGTTSKVGLFLSWSLLRVCILLMPCTAKGLI